MVQKQVNIKVREPKLHEIFQQQHWELGDNRALLSKC